MAAVPSRSLRLPKSRHLKQSREFARIRAQGRRLARGCLAANWITLPEGAPSKIGVITPRSIGNSVARSRARRLLREAFRVHQLDLQPSVDLVLIARASIANKSFHQVEHDFLAAMRNGGLLVGRGSVEP